MSSKKSTEKETTAKKSTTKKTVAKKDTGIKKTVAKKDTGIKKTAAKKSTVEKVVSKKDTSIKKTAAKKTATKESTTKKTIAKKDTGIKKTAAKKSIVKKTTTKKTITKKTVDSNIIVDMINMQAIHYVPQDVDIVRELPERYNETKIVFMVRDPEWSYFYWDISDYDYTSNNLDQKQLHVKIFRLSGVDISKHNEYIDVEVTSSYGSWYIMLGVPHCYFIAELGYYDDKGHFIVLTKSNVIYTPRNTISELFDDEWMCEGELTKLLFESYEITNTLSSASLFNMVNIYTLGGSSSFAASSSDLVKK